MNIDKSALVATCEMKLNVIKSARNIPSVKMMPANLLNVVDMTSHKVLLLTEDAVRQVEQLWGKEGD